MSIFACTFFQKIRTIENEKAPPKMRQYSVFSENLNAQDLLNHLTSLRQ